LTAYASGAGSSRPKAAESCGSTTRTATGTTCAFTRSEVRRGGVRRTRPRPAARVVRDKRRPVGQDCRLMKLMRVGAAGAEKPVVRVDEATYVDVSDLVADFDEAFFRSGGPATLAGPVAERIAAGAVHP